MRKLWGPLGWMTLHSISALYPNEPSQDDKNTLKEFLNLFAETIVCPHCSAHFGEMFSIYRQRYPNWADSRINLFVFICRAHNSVNRRLDKPIIKTIEDCIETLRNNTLTTSSQEFRDKYFDYIRKSWIRDRTESTMYKITLCNNISRINQNYWNKLSQEVNFEYLPDVDVTENIGKILPNMILNSAMSTDLKFLKRVRARPVSTNSTLPEIKPLIPEILTTTVVNRPMPSNLTFLKTVKFRPVSLNTVPSETKNEETVQNVQVPRATGGVRVQNGKLKLVRK